MQEPNPMQLNTAGWNATLYPDISTRIDSVTDSFMISYDLRSRRTVPVTVEAWNGFTIKSLAPA